MSDDDVSPESRLQTAFARSNLASLPPEAMATILASGNMLTLPAGSRLHREGSRSTHLQLVVSGLMRVSMQALDGRMLTVRYCRPGSILGAVSLFAEAFTMPASVRAVTDAEVFAMSAPTIRDLANRDVVVARALIDELSDRVMSFISEIPRGAFTTVRQRVARHLLDLASSSQRDAVLVASISQQELAEAVGSVREVVVRVLRELREQGWVETGHNGITLLDPERLSAEAYPVATGTQVPPS